MWKLLRLTATFSLHLPCPTPASAVLVYSNDQERVVPLTRTASFRDLSTVNTFAVETSTGANN